MMRRFSVGYALFCSGFISFQRFYKVIINWALEATSRDINETRIQYGIRTNSKIYVGSLQSFVSKSLCFSMEFMKFLATFLASASLLFEPYCLTNFETQLQITLDSDNLRFGIENLTRSAYTHSYAMNWSYKIIFLVFLEQYG